MLGNEGRERMGSKAFEDSEDQDEQFVLDMGVKWELAEGGEKRRHML